MLHTTRMVIFYGHKLKKQVSENLVLEVPRVVDYVGKRRVTNFEVPRVKNCNSRLCTNPLGSAQHPEKKGETHKYCLKHALNRLDGHFVWSQCQKG